MDSNSKKIVLRIDTIIQKIFLCWLGFGIGVVSIATFFHYSSLHKSVTEFFAVSAYVLIFCWFIALPFFGVFNLVMNFLHFKYGSYSEKVKFFRRIYNFSILAFLVFVVIYSIINLLFSYSIIDEGVVLLFFLIVGVLFGLIHSYITLLENNIRKKMELQDEKPILF